MKKFSDAFICSMKKKWAGTSLSVANLMNLFLDFTQEYDRVLIRELQEKMDSFLLGFKAKKVEEKTPVAKKEVPVKKEEKKAVPAKKVVPVKKEEKKVAPTKKATPVKKEEKKAAPAKKVVPTKKATPSKKVISTVKKK